MRFCRSLRAGLLMLALAGGAALAQDYPSRAIRLIVPYPAGGSADVAGRLAGELIAERLRAPVVVDNRPGANSQLGHELAAKAPPDGYTILLSTSGAPTLPHLNKSFNLDLRKDFSPITQLAAAPLVLAVPASAPWRNVQELAAHVRANPGKVNFGASGSADQFAGYHLGAVAAMRFVTVPYKGAVAAITALSTDEVQFVLLPWGSIKPLADAGKVRPLAVTSARRFALLPELPSIAEAGIQGFDVSFWHALLAPAGTPADIVARLQAAAVAGLRTPQAAARMQGFGMAPAWTTPEGLAALVDSELKLWSQVALDNKITPQ